MVCGLILVLLGMLLCALGVAPRAGWAAEGHTSGEESGEESGARVAEAFAAFRRQVVMSEIQIAPLDDFPSGAALLATLRRLSTREIGARQGFWRFHFVAFPDPAPDTAEVWTSLTDVTEPGRRREVKVFEMSAQPGARSLLVDDVVLTEAMGFQHGHTYEVAVTRGDGDAAFADGPAGAASGSGRPSGSSRSRSAVLAVGVITLK